ncbi:ribonucleoside-diphosphate reductase, adenosylcobalamin-dependent [Candidatus Pacearchaeota archaeon]|nr:ribonucleoside-diphosphate reductase, adenosylcobalamin-dependent [Candidatus Pacearchaeota archaeon]
METNNLYNGENGSGGMNGDSIEKGVGSVDLGVKSKIANGVPMILSRQFSLEGKNPFEFDLSGNKIAWVEEDVKVTDDSGKEVFIQKNVRKPDFWSPLALKVVASKYFWGNQDKGEREQSVEQLVGRISRFYKRQAIKQGYFDENEASILGDEITAICLNQLGVFNSPVWFNVGITEYDKEAGGTAPYFWDLQKGEIVETKRGEDKPQCSACFIQGMTDDMESILEVQVSEANLFRAGSGTGSNRSALRSSKERLKGGGWASGPVSFMKGYDAYAGVIKSGGKTRRAAKMEILNVDHPDIMEFVGAKQNEEKKAWALIEQGYSGGLNGEAYSSVAFQNCNMSARVSDEFMEQVKKDGDWQTKAVKTGEVVETLKAKEIMKKIAEGTWICGDPGIQNDTLYNQYHTSKASGRINATNPCSEYAFLDDTACNLASINLMKFRTAEGGFDFDKFRKVVRTLIVAMELNIDGASYPTKKITERSHIFRTLGLGYANLGALLMSLGLPYDSDEGRAVAAAVTAVMCGEAYKASAELAGMVGPFPGYDENREHMLKVIDMHRNHVKEIDVEKIPGNLKELVNVAWDCWTEALELGKKYGYRNAQATVLAPTGTIAFMMDCDTTGVEPDIALVKYKVLSGGGMLKIVNRSVGLALRQLGYGEEDVKKIEEYIDEKETIEGCELLKEEHLAVFDCAFKPDKGKRSIEWKGHVDMMSVTQPFISGSISKTVNMPEESTIENIMEAYMYAWEKRLKAVAIYRENSKRSQPLNTKKTKGEMWDKDDKFRDTIGERNKLPQTRKSMTHKFEITGHEGYLTIGMYDDGRPGEIFITMHKQGSTIRGLMDAWATSVSINLQYGASVEAVFQRFRHQKFEPAGFVKNLGGGILDDSIRTITTASSIVDYVSQFMLNNFASSASKPQIEVATPLIETEENEEQAELADFGHEGLTCPLCGGPAKRIANCAIRCTSCNQTVRSGCGE